MEQLLNRPVKEVITKFPGVGQILEAYHIGCVPCSVGACLLKDIVGIHNLAEEEEQEMLAQIAEVIYLDRKIEIPKAERKANERSREIKHLSPTQKLVDEHVLIKRWIALIPQVLEDLNLESAEDLKIISEGADFIRSYADKFHHAKEEDILFKYFDENLGILKMMLDEHTNARSHVKALVEAIEKKDKRGIVEHLHAYGELLTEHIKKEDEILYPWVEWNLSEKEVGELFSKFNEVDEISGNGVTERCRAFVIKVEEKIQTCKKEVLP